MHRRILRLAPCCALAISLLIGACSGPATLSPVAQVAPSVTATNTAALTQPPTPTPTATSAPTVTPAPSDTATPLPPTPTPTAANTATPTATVSPTPLPSHTPTPPPPTATPVLPTPSSTPAPQPAPATHAYPPIPPGKGLLYVINFHGDEAQFYFIGQEGEYVIPGKGAAPEGGVLELFLDPGVYRWASRIPTASLAGEGELAVVAGQVHGLGLSQGQVGSRSVVEGFLIGSDPFAPAQTPAPTPIPTPPTPAPGKVVLVLDSGSYSGDVQFPGATRQIQGGKWLFLEVDPGFQDINVTYYVPGGGDSACGGWPDFHCGPTGLSHFKFQLTLPADSICNLFIGAQQSEGSLKCGG